MMVIIDLHCIYISNGKVSYYWGKILRRKIISELLARILKLMSFIKLVLCNESPRENKSSL